MKHDDDELQRWIHGAAPRAWRAARRSAIDDAAASDAVQDALLGMLRDRPSGSAALDADEFVARSVRAARDSKRSAARRRVRELRHAMDAAERRPAPGAADDSRNAALSDAVRTLPEDERELVALRFRDGLSFAAIGTALGLSESSAHRRMGRVLSALRGRLATLGGAGAAALAADDAALAAGLGEWGRAGASAAAPPAGLTESLLAQARGGSAVGAAAKGAAVFSGARALVATAVVLTLGLGAAWAVDGPGDRESAVDGPARVAPAASAGPLEVVEAPGPESGAPPPARAAADLGLRGHRPEEWGAQDTRFVLIGRILDAGGRAVPGAQITAETVERRGKVALWAGATRSSPEGRYTLFVPFSEDLAGRESVSLRIRAGRLGYVLRHAEPVRAEPGGAATLDLQLALPPGERPGAATVDVLVRDVRGEPVAGALVELSPVTPRDRARVGPDVPFHEWSTDALWLRLEEGRARTDERGRARLATERLGAKSLWVEPSTDHAPERVVLPVLADGQHAQDVVVSSGRHIRGDVAWVGGAALTPLQLRALQMHVVLEPNRWRDVEVGADGRFDAMGLPPGSVTLRVGPSWSWPDGAGARPSNAHLEVLTASTPLQLRLKRHDDPRAHGHHRAELHGRVIDARTGESLPRDAYDLFAWGIQPLPAGDLEGDLLPNVFSPPPVQRESDGHPMPAGDGFHEVGLGAGTFMLQVTPSGPGERSGHAGPIVLAEDEVRSGIEVRFARPATLVVTVVDPGGRPVEGAYAFVTGRGPFSDSRVAEADAAYADIDGRGTFHANGNAGRRTREGGSCEIPGVPADLQATVAAIHPDFEPGRSARIELEPGGRVKVTVELGAARD